MTGFGSRIFSASSASGGGEERRGVQQRDGAAAGDRVQARAGERRDQPQALADGLQRGVGGAEQLGRNAASTSSADWPAASSMNEAPYAADTA